MSNQEQLDKRWSVVRFFKTAAEGFLDKSEQVGRIGPKGYKSCLDVALPEDYSLEARVRLEEIIMPSVDQSVRESAWKAFQLLYVEEVPLLTEELRSAMFALCQATKANLIKYPFPNEEYFQCLEIYWTRVEIAKKLGVSPTMVSNYAAMYSWKSRRAGNEMEFRADDVERDRYRLQMENSLESKKSMKKGLHCQ